MCPYSTQKQLVTAEKEGARKDSLNAELESEVHNLKPLVSTLQDAVSASTTLSTDLDKMKQELDALQQAKRELEHRLKAKTTECAQMAADVDRLKRSEEELRSGKQGADVHNKEMQATLQKLDAEVHDLIEQLRLVDESLQRY